MQKVPAIDSDTGAINKTWWLALKAQNALVNQLAGASQGLFTALTIVANAVSLDLGVATNFEITLNQAAQVTISNPVFTGGVIASGTSFFLYVDEDATGQRPALLWGNAFGQDVQTQVMKGDASTRSVYAIKFHPDSLWHLDNFLTGLPLS